MKCNYIALGIVSVLASATFADTCPPAPSSVIPTLTSKVSFNKKTNMYKYEYTFGSDKSSLIPIKELTLDLEQQPSSILSPTKWVPDFYTLNYMPFHLLWSALVSTSDTKNEKSYGSLVADSAIRPGKALSGFSFESPNEPGIVQFHAAGKTGVPATDAPTLKSDDDEPTPNCTGWDFSSPRYQTLVTGMTTGPSNPNTTSVVIRLRDEKAKHACKALNPQAPSGKISVLVLATKNFDPSKIDVSTLKFGPAGAAPLSSKLVGIEDRDIVGHDEREEWEKILSVFDANIIQDKKSKSKNLLLVFDEASLQIKCVLDRALFIKGHTIDGINIIGAASSQLTGCDIRHPGVRASRDANKREVE